MILCHFKRDQYRSLKVLSGLSRTGCTQRLGFPIAAD
jgi:hypothetical protein